MIPMDDEICERYIRLTWISTYQRLHVRSSRVEFLHLRIHM